MAYTIVKSDGTVLTTIADGTINTSSTSLGLPGRNYAGYGQSLDTNFVHVTENFADSTPPANPLRGQIWYDTSDTTLKVCPTDGESNSLAWLSLTSTASGGNTTFGSVNITGNATANNFTATNEVTANAITAGYLTISANATIADASITTANIGTLTTTAITTGSATTPGTLTGIWTVTGNTGANASAILLDTGGIFINNSGNLYGIRTDKYMYANGDPISFAGTYSNSNVASYLPTYNGNILTVQTQATTLTTGANTTAGTITGNWTLSTGSRLTATYADLAERFSADDVYEPGTVVELGGSAEITAVKYELSEDVFGVISDNMAFLMNNGAGDNDTHPAVAMTGRVRVKTLGTVRKGQRLVSAGEGYARAADNGESTAFNVIGRALEDKTTIDLGTVEAIVTIK
jgi:hypothetical protein|tara:strand:- start:4732 stop:5949 length:1218 start_codon:yes stop_codon:yes gene_type:complete